MKRNHGKPSNIKKTLVRNAEQPLHKTVTVLAPKAPAPSRVNVIPTECSSRSSSGKAPDSLSTKRTTFNVPEMHSTLKLSKKIDEIVKCKKTKCLSEADKTKRSVVKEKVSRKVNFPYGESVFKDLIPLTDNEVKVKPVVVTRGPVYQKDPEPVLSDFLQPRLQKIYYNLPRISCQSIEESRQICNDGLRLYKVLQINTEL